MFIKKSSKAIIIAVGATLMTSCIGRAPANHIGDLGGFSVDLPRNLVHLVEYDGDPAWGKKREGKNPHVTMPQRLIALALICAIPITPY